MKKIFILSVGFIFLFSCIAPLALAADLDLTNPGKLWARADNKPEMQKSRHDAMMATIQNTRSVKKEAIRDRLEAVAQKVAEKRPAASPGRDLTQVAYQVHNRIKQELEIDMERKGGF